MIRILLAALAYFTLVITPLNAQNTSSEDYVIEKHDTLWSISDTRLEDPFLWPKLWSVNPHINNPDLIFPGIRINIPSREELMNMPPVPLKRTPFVKTPEPKIDEARSVWKLAPIVKKKYIVDKNLLIASGWIAESFPGVGEITYSPTNRSLVSKGEIVYVKINQRSTETNLYYAIRNIKTVNHPVSRNKIGKQIRVTGIVELLESDKSKTKAKVTSSFEDVQIGDGLLPYYEIEPPLIQENPRTPDFNGYILESHKNAYLLGSGAIIFLDKGSSDGIALGDVFSVISDKHVERSIGKIQVVSLQPDTSGAIVIESGQEVTVGARWGQVATK